MPRSAYCALALAIATASCSEPELAAPPGRGSARTVAKPAIFGAESPSADGGGAGAPGSSAAGAAGASATSSVCTPHQAVLTADMSNARDLGGTPLSDGSSVACGAIFRGPPLRLSEDGCSNASQLGLRTIIDLRIEGERVSVPDASCLDAALVFAPLPVPYGLAAADYLNDLHETTSIAQIFHTFGDPAAYPIYFHCTFGRDRTGVVGALVLLALGASRATVMDEYLLSQPNVGAYPDSLEAVLDEVEQRGGIETVLHDAGISDDELAVLHEKAIAIE